MKINKTKFDGLDGLVHVRWEIDKGPIIADASQAGIKLTPALISTRLELGAFAKLVDEAWREHLKLVPKITRTLSGHE